MRLLRRLRNQALGVAAVCVVGYVAYHVLLDDKAKSEMRSLAHTVSDSCHQVANIVNSRIGTIMDEDVVAQNRQQIRDAWDDLGF